MRSAEKQPSKYVSSSVQDVQASYLGYLLKGDATSLLWDRLADLALLKVLVESLENELKRMGYGPETCRAFMKRDHGAVTKAFGEDRQAAAVAYTLAITLGIIHGPQTNGAGWLLCEVMKTLTGLYAEDRFGDVTKFKVSQDQKRKASKPRKKRPSLVRLIDAMLVEKPNLNTRDVISEFKRQAVVDSGEKGSGSTIIKSLRDRTIDLEGLEILRVTTSNVHYSIDDKKQKTSIRQVANLVSAARRSLAHRSTRF